MKFVVNDINAETKSIGIKHISHSKIQLPHQLEIKSESASKKNTVNNYVKPASSNTHSTNLATITIGAAGLSWLIFR